MVKSIRDSGEFRESKGFGVAGPGLRDDKQKERGRQAGKELKEALQRGKTNIKGTEYTGKLADAMRTANINQFNRRQLRRRALEDAPERLGFGDAFRSIGRGITGLTSQLSPQRVIGSLIGNALLPGIGGLLGGIIGGTYAADDESNNFFGNVGASLKKDITDTINFFRPQQVEQPMMTNIPMKRPTQFTPTLDSSFLESDFGTLFTEEDAKERGISDGPVAFENPFGIGKDTVDFLDYQFNPRRSIFDATGGQTLGTTPNLGIDSLMQPRQITINPGMGVDVVTYGDGLPVTYGTSPDDPMQGGFIGYSGTGPISVDFDTMGQPLTQRQIETLRRN